jgi:hypothetical protein
VGEIEIERVTETERDAERDVQRREEKRREEEEEKLIFGHGSS